MKRGILAALIVVAAGTLFGATVAAAADTPPPAPLVEEYLLSGKLADGESALVARLKEAPEDDQARFGLGTVQLVRGVERLVQSFHRYGLHDPTWGFVPFLRLPVPANGNPESLSYADSRRIFEEFLEDLKKVEATLAEVKDTEVKLPLHFGLIRLDMNSDGKAVEEESLWKLYAALNWGAAQVTRSAASEFVITFDAADVQWLRGYCHLLGAFCEMILAHDWKESFERTGHLFYAKAESPYDFLKASQNADQFDNAYFTDVIAFIHLINFPVVEPERMKAALEHLEAVIGRSREMWKLAAAETDDDHEWIPNPKQTGVIPNVRVSEEMVAGWHTFLDEAEAILAGKKLVPFWRSAGEGRGVNLRRVFTEPRTFDLVLWVQGTAAVPYLEEGSVTQPNVWFRFGQIFRGNFIGFAIWFN